MTRAGKIAIVLALSSLASVATAEKNCTQSNGYKYSVCGDGLKDANQLCCKAAEKCVQIKPWSGDDKVVCSAARQLNDQKAVKIVIIPLFFLLVDIALIAYLVLRCKGKESPITMLCVVAIALSWPFLFSKYWTFGAYTAFLAAMVACAGAPSVDSQNLAWWTYRLVWVLAIFEVIALFGPDESFHVPIFDWSKTASNTELIKNIYNEADCNTHFNEYFKVLSIEKDVKEADPDAVYNGYCAKNWLATVQSFAVIQSMLWIGIVLVSAPKLLTYGGGWVGGVKVFDSSVAERAAVKET